MSFILDALKKSENDRQRQSGPALFEVRVAPPRSKLPLLAAIIVSLLVVNLGVVGWIMLRRPATAAVPPASAAAASPVAAPLPTATALNTQQSAAGQAQPVVQNAPPSQGFAQNAQANTPPPGNMPPQGYNQAAPNNGYSQNNGYAPNGYPPNGYAQNGYAPNGYGQNGYAQNAYAQNGANNGYPPPGANYAPPNSPGAFEQPRPEPSLSDQDSTLPRQEPYNPDDYAPAREPPPPGTGAGRVRRGTVSGLPTYAQAATQTSIPPLHMDLHSYAADPSKRFVLINMKRLYEGQSLPEGPKVESITNDAAIMSYNGTRFVLDK
jgi:general secretion pathway protein B